MRESQKKTDDNDSEQGESSHKIDGEAQSGACQIQYVAYMPADLDTESVHDVRWFDAERKNLFIETALKLWPNISKICEVVGVHPQTYYNHKKTDPQFAACMEAVRQARLDRIEAVSADMAENPTKGFLDRAMMLRAHRPELYDRAKVVKIEGYKMGDGERQNRIQALEVAVDAEISKTYLNRKQQREQRQQQRLSAGKGDGGETAGGEGDGHGKS